ncbi:Aldo/keto reductase [Hymenopellis radicata]|nr:Aldo/keto reductase [Hymenopellis radicata]
MAANNHTSVETFQLGPFVVPRIWTGLWQLSSSAWGSPSVSQIRQGMKRHVERGYTSFADHYGSAEIIFGQFKGSLSDASCVIGATKWCVFKNISPTREVVEAAVRERLDRMQTRRIDLLQFHWQMYENKGYLTALQELEQLRHEGLIAAIGLCNFDSIRTDEICTQLGPGVVVSNQVQFSLIDTRPLHGMSDVCMRHQLKLLTYGTLCGGFLSDQWFHQPEPDAYTAHLTPSQRKARYLDMIKAWGNWKLFQKLLALLRVIGDRHGGLSIANIATRWVLDHEFVGAVIIGARLGLSEHSDDNLKVFGWSLTDDDREEIESVLSLSKGRKIITTIGDCGAEYR